MRVERVRPAVLRVTLHAYEMAALVAAARWAVEGGGSDLDPQAREQIKAVVDGYDTATRAAAAGPAPRTSGPHAGPSPPEGPRPGDADDAAGRGG